MTTCTIIIIHKNLHDLLSPFLSLKWPFKGGEFPVNFLPHVASRAALRGDYAPPPMGHIPEPELILDFQS